MGYFICCLGLCVWDRIICSLFNKELRWKSIMLWNSNKLTYLLLALETTWKSEQRRTWVTVFSWTETAKSTFPILRLPWNNQGNIISLLKKNPVLHKYTFLLNNTVLFWSSTYNLQNVLRYSSNLQNWNSGQVTQASYWVCRVLCTVVERVHIHIASFLWSGMIRKLVFNL